MNTSSTVGKRGSVSRGRGVVSPRVVLPTNHDLTVVIPAYNEEQRLPWTLAEIAVFLNQWGVDYRVMVVDDGSTDRTAELTRGLGPRFSTLRVTPQGGKGRAVRLGMLHATGCVVAFTDADLPFELTALRQGYDWIRQGQCQVVFGARDIEGAGTRARRRFWRRFTTLAFRQLVHLTLSHEVTDTQCGLKLFERRAALEIFGRATIDAFAFDTEVVMLTHRLGLSFRRVPVVLVNESTSTLRLRRNALPMLLDVMRIWLRDRMGIETPSPQFIFAGVEDAQDERRKAAA